jgi:hypothetical protein
LEKGWSNLNCQGVIYALFLQVRICLKKSERTQGKKAKNGEQPDKIEPLK